MTIWVSSCSAIHMWKPAGRIKNKADIFDSVSGQTYKSRLHLANSAAFAFIFILNKLSFLNDRMYFDNCFSYVDCFFYWDEVNLAVTFKFV
jgi:hypothetical protein